ncbi:MAG: antibiotic biosynthesis monooxygenase [Pseudomonadota bacterium]|nr:antibiotic biosynthesis monooxygenase [Pseudomonadota bacterium]
MAAVNVVRFRVKPGNEQQFIDAHRKMQPTLKGFLGGSLIKTGDQTFCMVGQWRNFQSIVNARPQMIAMLDEVRDLLAELGGGLGLTDPVSGEVVVKLAAPKAAKKRPARVRRTTKPTAGKRPAGKRAAAKRKR